MSAAAGSSPGAEAATELYAAILQHLAPRISLFVRRGFFEPLVAGGLESDSDAGVDDRPAARLVLLAPSAFHRDWMRDHYQEELDLAASAVLREPATVGVIFDEDRRTEVLATTPRTPSSEEGSPVFEASPPGREPQASMSAQAHAQMTAPRPPSRLHHAAPRAPQRAKPGPPPAKLHAKYTFDTFVVGPSNRMAFESCQAVAEAPGRLYSPLFLFGKTGLGKTHLLHALGQEALAARPDLRVVYMSAEQWVNEYIHDIRNQRFDEFRRRYRSGCDLLLIDDIQFLAGKDASQDEFFHTFNSLHDSRRQIVVTADRYPHEIEGLEQRLMTRLSWGLIADIQTPEMETRVAILSRKADALGLYVEASVLHFLADHIVSSVRALEGALIRLSAYASVTKSRLDLATAKDVLRPVLARRRDLDIDRICTVVAGYYDVAVKELKGKSRQRRLTLARQMAMYLARKHLGASLPEIGRHFSRDHTTVLSSVRKVAGMMATDASTQAVVARLERDLL